MSWLVIRNSWIRALKKKKKKDSVISFIIVYKHTFALYKKGTQYQSKLERFLHKKEQIYSCDFIFLTERKI